MFLFTFHVCFFFVVAPVSFILFTYIYSLFSVYFCCCCWENLNFSSLVTFKIEKREFRWHIRLEMESLHYIDLPRDERRWDGKRVLKEIFIKFRSTFRIFPGNGFAKSTYFNIFFSNRNISQNLIEKWMLYIEFKRTLWNLP